MEPRPPPRSSDPHVLLSSDGKYVRGIDARGAALYSWDKADAWAVDKSYAYRLKSAYQLRDYKVVPFGP